MTNIFIDTGYRQSEEDRLTNALMALLEHSDRRVLDVFLSLCGAEDMKASSTTQVGFHLQPSFDQSRPDAWLSFPGFDIYVETKRGSSLDRDQFERHWSYLLGRPERSAILLAITGSHVIPTIVTEKESGAQTVTAAHLSWSSWLGAMVCLKEDFPPDTATSLLLRQFEAYLRSLGYWCFNGPPADRVNDLGYTLHRHYKIHRGETIPYLNKRFFLLAQHLQKALPARMPWNVTEWGRRGVFDPDKYGIVRTDCVLNDFGPKTCFRVSLNWLPPGRLELMYYLTVWHTERHFQSLGEALLAGRENLERFAPFHAFGFWPSRQGFHCAKVASPELVTAFLNGDDLAVDQLAEDIAPFFEAIDAQSSIFNCSRQPAVADGFREQ